MDINATGSRTLSDPWTCSHELVLLKKMVSFDRGKLQSMAYFTSWDNRNLNVTSVLLFKIKEKGLSNPPLMILLILLLLNLVRNPLGFDALTKRVLLHCGRDVLYLQIFQKMHSTLIAISPARMSKCQIRLKKKTLLLAGLVHPSLTSTFIKIKKIKTPFFVPGVDCEWLLECLCVFPFFGGYPFDYPQRK